MKEKTTEALKDARAASPLVCYCFGLTEEEIRRDAQAHGRSLLIEKIQAAKAQGGCRCPETNPNGR